MEGFRKNLKKSLVYGGTILAGFILFSSAASAATLFLAPSSGNYNVGSNFSVVVKVNSGGVPINAAEGTIVFNPNELSVVSLSKSGSVFNLWVQEPDFSNALGTINFGGIIFNPGYTGASGTFLTITLKAKAVGSTILVFSSGAILANDGLGTNILSAMSGGTYLLKTSSAVPQTAPEAPAAPSAPSGGVTAERSSIPAPVTKSPTHPDQSKWYSNNNPEFQWDLPAGAIEIWLVLSKKLSGIPQVRYSPPISEKKLENLVDGVWYLNTRFKTAAGTGPISSFKFQIDTGKPDDFEITRVDLDDLTNPRPELIFESDDGISGIDRYEIKIGEGDWFNIEPGLAGRPYKLPFQSQSPGVREVWVKAMDRAGNSASADTKIVVKSIQAPAIEIIPPKIKAGEIIIVRGGGGGGGTKIVLNVLKLKKTGHFGLGILEFAGIAEEKIETKLIKTIETVTDENNNFEVKVGGLEPGAYILRAYNEDRRGAISDASNDVLLEVEGKLFFTQFAEWVPNAILRGFNALINFVINGWLIIIAGILVVGLIRLLIKEIIPAIVREIKKFAYIFNDYKASGQLRKKGKKMQFEIKELYKDIKKELDLLERIGRHRGLHSDEKYTKKKLEKYLGLLKSLK